MSGTDPLAAISARVVAAAEAAMLDAAINLGVSADVLETQISLGDVLPAQVLPPQNGQDYVQLLGLRVAAQLPPAVYPGETLLLQVTGFSGTQIFVRNLGAPDPANPVAVNDAVLPGAQSETLRQSAVLTTVRVPQGQTPLSPPSAVFVAASVQPASPQSIEARIAAAQTAKAPPPSVTPKNVTPLVQRAVQTVSEFLRAARLPDTPFTRIAATIAPHAPERVSPVLQRLEAALPRTAQDPRIPTLRTLVGFTARLNPANPETLRAQISSYVSNVVEGVEAKLAQLLQAHAQAAPAPHGQSQTQTHAQPEKTETATQSAPRLQTQSQPRSNDAATTPAPVAVQARIAERAAAVSHDLKSVVLSLLRDPPAERTPALTQALSETLITLTGTQVNALTANQQNPGTFAFSLPVFYREGGKPAQIRISHDADSRGGKIDAENFHVAFVLDTANLGMVAIDLQTSGRAVKVAVKTETAPAAAQFSDTLASLRNRLEDLRYRVASAAASIVARKGPVAAESVAAPDARKSGLDLQA